MKVILKKDVQDLGSAGQTIEVKDGFGHNYLFPRNLAIPATKVNLKAIGEIEKQKVIQDRKRRREGEVIKEKIEKLSLSVEALVGEDDKMFGSVTSNDIAELLQKDGVTIDKRAIELESPIKVLGVYTVPIKVEREVTANLRLWVIKKT